MKYPQIQLNQEIWLLVKETGSFFFTIKSILDNLSTLVAFMSGEKQRFSDFFGYIKALKKDQTSNEMFCYINEKMEWVYVLRDIRNYMTHIGNINIDLYEDEDKNIKAYMQNLYCSDDLVTFLTNCYNGLNNYLIFYDQYYSTKIINEFSD